MTRLAFILENQLTQVIKYLIIIGIQYLNGRKAFKRHLSKHVFSFSINRCHARSRQGCTQLSSLSPTVLLKELVCVWGIWEKGCDLINCPISVRPWQSHPIC